MKRNNVKLLTESEFDYINNKFVFTLDKKNIVVGFRHIGRKTPHPIDKPFTINVRKVRLVRFTLDAIDIWIALKKKNYNYTLLDVQQSVNKLVITFQQVDEENVLKLLSGNDIKIKKI